MFVRTLPLLPLLLVLGGCPDPTASTDGAKVDMLGPGGQGQPGAGGPGGQGQPGTPGQPGAEGGMPGEGVPGGARPTPPGFQVTAGEGVKLSGTVSYTGVKTGKFRIDFLQQTEGNGFPRLVHSTTLDAAGPWEVEAPKGSGDLKIVSFLDANDNGPDPTEPAGRVKQVVMVADAAIPGLDIVLTDEPDLGDLKPGGPGQEGKGGPPPGGGMGMEGGAPPKDAPAPGGMGGPPPTGGAGAGGAPASPPPPGTEMPKGK